MSKLKANLYAVIIHGVSNSTGDIQTYITKAYTKAYANKLVEDGMYQPLFKNGNARILKDEKYNSLKTLGAVANKRGIHSLELVELI